MSEAIDASGAVAMVPGWDPAAATIEALRGGLTNRSYRVRYDDEDFVLRLDTLPTGAIPVERSCEPAILAAAARAGIGPEVVFADPGAGVLVTRYLPGRAWDEPDVHSPAGLEKLAGLLRDAHALPPCGRRADFPAAAETYRQVLAGREGLHAFATRCAAIVDAVAMGAGAQAICCHNDVVAANVIEGDRLWLIDWEYACDNDPLFDLASVIGFHDLDGRRSACLLQAYAGGMDGELRERLAEQVRLYDAIQWLWLAARQCLDPQPRQARRLEALQQRIR